MAKTIKGLTIEIDGNTTKLSKALDEVNKESKNISSELSQVNKLLKFEPDNVVLLEQKQQLLAKAVENTKKKLETLEKAQESVNKQFQDGDIGEEEYRAFQREIIKTKSQLDNFSDKADKAAKGIKDVGDKADSSTGKMAALGYGVEQIGDKMSVVSSKIVDFGSTLIDTYKEVGQSSAQIEAAAESMGVNIDQVQSGLNKMVGITGELDSSTEALNNLINTGMKADEINNIVDQLAGAVVSFPDTLKFESLADSLQESMAQGELTGQFAELLERLGYDLEKVQEEFNKASSEGEAYNLVMELLSDMGMKDVGDEYISLNQAMYDNNVKTNELKDAMSEMGEKLMPLLNTLIDLATSAIEWFNGLDGTWQTIILTIAGLVAIIGPLLSLLGPLIMMAGSLNVAILPIIGTVAAVVAGIAAVIAIGVALYKNWDKIIAWGKKLLKSLGETFKSIGNSIGNTFKSVIQWGKNLLNRIGNTMSSIGRTIGNTMSNVGRTIKNAWNGVMDFFRSLPSRMVSMGKDVINGLVNGIKSKVNAIKDACRDVVSSITGKVKGLLGIASPSKVMFEMGEYTGEGLALGIEDTIDKVKKATQNLANRVTETMGNTKLGNNTIVNNTNPYMEVVVPIDGKIVARQTVQYTAVELDKYSNRKLTGRGNR